MYVIRYIIWILLLKVFLAHWKRARELLKKKKQVDGPLNPKLWELLKKKNKFMVPKTPAPLFLKLSGKLFELWKFDLN